MRNIRQNLFFAFVYNAAGIPIAAGVLYPAFGLLLSPDDRRGRDGPVLGQRHRQRPAAARHETLSCARRLMLGERIVVPAEPVAVPEELCARGVGLPASAQLQFPRSRVPRGEPASTRTRSATAGARTR